MKYFRHWLKRQSVSVSYGHVLPTHVWLYFMPPVDRTDGWSKKGISCRREGYIIVQLGSAMTIDRTVRYSLVGLST